MMASATNGDSLLPLPIPSCAVNIALVPQRRHIAWLIDADYGIDPLKNGIPLRGNICSLCNDTYWITLSRRVVLKITPCTP